MRRGTTPTLTIKLNGILVADLKTIKVTFKQKSILLSKTEKDVDIDVDENTISVPFSQEDTLLFKKGNVEVQLRALLEDGTTAIASKIKSFDMEEILLEGVLQSEE